MPAPATPPAKPKPRSRDRATTEAALIAAASAVFADKGYENATTKGIAEAAGYSEALIQRYFNGKEGLLLAVLKHEQVGTEDTQFLKRPLCANLTEEAREMLTHALAGFAVRSEKMRIVLARVLVDPSFKADFNRVSVRNQIRTGLKARLARYVEAGLLDASLDLTAITECLMGLIFQLGFVHRQILQTSEPDIRGLVDHFAEFFGRAVSAAPQTPSPKRTPRRGRS